MSPANDQQVMFLTALEEQAAGIGKQRRGDTRATRWHLSGEGLCGELVFPTSTPGSGILLEFLMESCMSCSTICSSPVNETVFGGDRDDTYYR
jgi:hypothetical protein